MKTVALDICLTCDEVFAARSDREPYCDRHRLRWCDGPEAPVETPPDQYNRSVGAPMLFEME